MMGNFWILILFIILILPVLSSQEAAGAGGGNFVRPLDPKEKFSHIRFYWHVVQPVNTSTLPFGRITIFDSAMRVGPNLSSNTVGRSQGLYALVSQDYPEVVSFLMIMNIVFTEGKYNGSTITLLGNIGYYKEDSEIPVVGGTGHFRFAIGYAKLTTYSFSLATRETTIEYNIYVKHYQVQSSSLWRKGKET